MSPAAVLLTASEIIGRGWTQGAWARDRHGAKVSGASLTAVCWCAGDAIFTAAKQLNGDLKLVGAACKVLRQHIGCDIASWNDAPERTQAEVVAALRDAARSVQ